MAQLKIAIVVDDKGNVKLKGVKGSVDNINKSMTTLASTANVVKGALIAAFGAISVYQIINFSKEVLKSADAIGKLADNIDVSTKAIQEYQYVARLSGVDTNLLNKSLEQFAKRVGELRAGTGDLEYKLKDMNQELMSQLKHTHSTTDALNLMMKALASTDNAMDRAALAAAAFGRSGVKMVNIVKDGYEEFVRLKKEINDLGGVMDDELIRNAEEINNKFTTMQTIIKTQLAAAVIELAPIIISVAEGITKLSKAIGSFVREMRGLETLKFGMTPSLGGAGGSGASMPPGEWKAGKFYMDIPGPIFRKVDPELNRPMVNLDTEAIQKLMDQWKSFSDDASKIFTNALVDGSKDFVEQFRRLMASEFAQKFIQPMISDAMSALFMPGTGILGGVNARNALGAGAMGYGLGGVGGGIGAAGGMLLGGPTGALIGGALGGYIQDVFDNAPKKIPEIDTLWNIVGDQVELVSASWKDMSDKEGAKLIHGYRMALESQAEFFARLGAVTGKSSDHELGFGGREYLRAEQIKAQEIFQETLTGYKEIVPLMSPKFTETFKTLWEDILKSVTTVIDIGDFSVSYKLKQVLPTFDELLEMSGMGELEAYMAEKIRSEKGIKEKYVPDYVRAGIGGITSGFEESWEGILEQLEGKLLPFQEGIISTISGAFMEVPRSAGFQAFEDAFNQSLANSIKSSFSQMLGAQFVVPMTQALMPAFALSEQYIQSAMAGESTNFAPVAQEFMKGIHNLAPIFETMKPIWEMFNTAMDYLNAALGLNTDALTQNTDALIGPVEAFLRELTVGALAPAVSREGMQAEYNKLLEQAIQNPQAFSTFAGFARSDYLPFMQMYPDYAQQIEGIKGDVTSMPWYQQAQTNVNVNVKVELDGQEFKSRICKVIQTDPDVRDEIARVRG
jgi:hypothetical protein